MSELKTTQTPTVMTVSAFSGISQKLNFLAQAIKNESDAETRKLYIECFKEDRKINGAWEPVNVIRFSIDCDIWTEIHPYDKKDGDILPKNIAVNLFDFFNIVDNCKDDMISFWIDEDGESPEIVINSFYNEHRNQDELEVRMPIHDIDFPTRDLVDEDSDAVFTFELAPIVLYTVMAELNIENRTDGLSIIIDNGKLKFQSNYNGYKVHLDFNEHADINYFIQNASVFIPFNIMSLISGSGSITSLKFIVTDTHVIVNTDDYKFSYKIEKTSTKFSIDVEAEDFLVCESELMRHVGGLINRLNKSSNFGELVISKIDEFTAEITCHNKDRYKISVYSDFAVLSDNSLTIDSRIFERIFTKNMVDAIAVQICKNGDAFIKIVTPVYVKILMYNNEEFSNYRESL